MKHDKVFKEELGLLKDIKATFRIKDETQPKFYKARVEPYSLKPRIKNELNRLVQDGVISPVDTSEWATPLVPVVKPDGSLRLCGDFRVTINPVLEDINYPLPKIEDIFANLAGGVKFSKIDLASAYLQMEIEDDSKKYTTVNTSQGLYQYNRLPFGVKTSPALWQRAIEQVLAGLPGVQVYLDDILVTGRTDTEHLNNLDKVLNRLSDYNLRIKPKKCEWFQGEISYLGHKIDSHGLHTAPSKVEAIVNAPAPSDKTQLQSFLGLINYYGKFLPNLSTVLAPLNNLRNQNSKFVWSPECQDAFNKAKDLVVSSDVLTHYDPNLPLKLDCDASQYGLGAVISHVFPDGTERPIAFGSRTLSKSEKNYSQIEREALALIFGVKKFHSYLFGRKFVLVTDHRPLTTIFKPTARTPPITAARLQRWGIILSAYDYDIFFRSTKAHANADALSRLPTPFTKVTNQHDGINILYSEQLNVLPVTVTQIQTEIRKDPILSQVYDCVINGWAHVPKDTPELKPYICRKNELSVQQNILV